jgi:hypothetical protein
MSLPPLHHSPLYAGLPNLLLLLFHVGTAGQEANN